MQKYFNKPDEFTFKWTSHREMLIMVIFVLSETERYGWKENS